MSHSGTATFMGIPSELRQHILALTFEEPIDKDLKFNQIFRNFLFTAGPIITKLPSYTHGSSRLEETGPSTSFAPQTYALARALSAVHPDLIEEVLYVLSQQLDSFEKAERADHASQGPARGSNVYEATWLFVALMAARKTERGSFEFHQEDTIWAYEATVAQMLIRFCNIYSGDRCKGAR
jgi:hypothetical protein